MKKYPIKRGDILDIYSDGASRGNRGPAAWAFVYVNNNKIFYQNSDYIGIKTNNTAEYLAIINALKEAEKFHRGKVRIFSDSQLAIRQVNKEYRITKSHLSDLCNQVYKLTEKYEDVKFFHVGRNNTFIKKCDKLCNECLNSKGFKR